RRRHGQRPGRRRGRHQRPPDVPPTLRGGVLSRRTRTDPASRGRWVSSSGNLRPRDLYPIRVSLAYSSTSVFSPASMNRTTARAFTPVVTDTTFPSPYCGWRTREPGGNPFAIRVPIEISGKSLIDAGLAGVPARTVSPRSRGSGGPPREPRVAEVSP